VYLDEQRNKTRRERYDKKKSESITLPLSIATITFDEDDNLAFLIRSAACFGITNVYVIGSIPDRSFLKAKSGSLYDYVNLKSFSTPRAFLDFAKVYEKKIVAVELSRESGSLYEYKFDTDRDIIMVLGNEKTGVPSEIIMSNDSVYIPMIGSGYCLNVSQAGTAAMSEYCRQYMLSK